MAKKMERFYFTQDETTEGPYVLRQIQFMLKQGLIRADATIRSENGAEGDVDTFLSAYGWSEEGDDSDVAAKQLFWIRRIGVIIIIGGIIVVLFGFKISY